jgi:hypothetical protein
VFASTLPNLRSYDAVETCHLVENKTESTEERERESLYIGHCYANAVTLVMIFLHAQGSARRSRRAAAPAAASTTTRTARGAACRAPTPAPTRRRTSAGTASTSPRPRTSRSPTAGSTAPTAARPSSDPSDPQLRTKQRRGPD